MKPTPPPDCTTRTWFPSTTTARSTDGCSWTWPSFRAATWVPCCVDGPLEPARAVAIIDQIAGALHAAHKAGLIHRDVKPSNILLDEDGYAYLIDFGIARAAADTKLTGTGATIGTVAYMAPERFTTDEVDPRADIYALACVLCECLTGSQPFPGDSLERQLAGHLTVPPPRPSELRPGVPTMLDAVIATGMAKEPEHRYTSAKEFAAAARNAITVPATPPAGSPTEPVIPRSGTTTPAAAETPRGPPTVKATRPGLDALPGEVSPFAPTQHRADGAAAVRAGDPTVADARAAGTPAGQTRRWSRKTVIIAAAAALLVVATISAVTLTTTNDPRLTSPASTSPASASPESHTYGAQVTLPFTGLLYPDGVAVDTAGTVYVADFGNHRVVALAAGSTTQTVLPLTGIRYPRGVAVDTMRNVYIPANNSRVITLAAGATTQTVLPFTGVTILDAAAVDTAGNVYVLALTKTITVVKLSAGSNTQTNLPLTLNNAHYMAVDSSGNVYVVDSNDDATDGHVVKLAAGSNTSATLPLTGLVNAKGIAVDTAGNLYVCDAGKLRVLKYAAGSLNPTVLPFTGLSLPVSVAVDTVGNVYVIDQWRVIKLPVE